LQVLRHLPTRFSADVFSKLNDDPGSLLEGYERALRLPQDLLCRWLATKPAVLDLRSADITPLQWLPLFTALLQGGTHLTEIHIRVVDLTFHSSALAEVNSDAVRQCLEEGSTIVEESKNFRVDGMKDFEEILSRLECLTTDGSLKHTNDREAECAHMMSTLAGVLPHLTTLEHIGLHNMPLHTQLLRSLGQVLMSLPPSVTALTLTIAASVKKAGLLQRSMLFSAIGLVKSLRELHMPDCSWADFVGNDASCLKPLYQLPHLKAVIVSKVTQSAAFPEQLAFKEVHRA
jgi:hypothetical protein